MQTTTSVEVDRAADVVFAFVADHANNPRWQGGMESCVWQGDGPIAVGARYDQRASFLGRPILTTFEVTALDPGRSITITSVVSTFPIRVTRTVEALAPDRCRVTAEVWGDPPWFLRVPGMGHMIRRSIEGDYARLKALLEGPSPA
ncbi:MAG: SRPBCC family protein [Myxococcales bacterium]|nr:SRPBCC family protein [Myxococcales bacterium]